MYMHVSECVCMYVVCILYVSEKLCFCMPVQVSTACMCMYLLVSTWNLLLRRMKRRGITGMDTEVIQVQVQSKAGITSTGHSRIVTGGHLAMSCPTGWCNTAGCQTQAAPGLAVAHAPLTWRKYSMTPPAASESLFCKLTAIDEHLTWYYRQPDI